MAAGPRSAGYRRRRRPVPLPLLGLGILLVAMLAVSVTSRLLPDPVPAAAGTVTVRPTSAATTRHTPPRTLTRTPTDHVADHVGAHAEAGVAGDDSGTSPPAAAARTAARFVDAWLITQPSRRLAALKPITARQLYRGLTYSDPRDIPRAHRVGRPTPHTAGAYQAIYRVALSDGSAVYVETVYDGARWKGDSIEPAVR